MKIAPSSQVYTNKADDGLASSATFCDRDDAASARVQRPQVERSESWAATSYIPKTAKSKPMKMFANVSSKSQALRKIFEKWAFWTGRGIDVLKV